VLVNDSVNTSTSFSKSTAASADAKPLPNILLITLDQFRADCLSCAGHPVVQTPNLDRLAQQGVRFVNHYSNCAPCSPGRASLLTGLWQMNHRVTNNGAPLADNLPMLSRELRRAGYDPTLFGYTDTALDPAKLSPDDPRRCSYEQPMDGFGVGVLLDDNIDPWIDWLAQQGFPVPDENRKIYEPDAVEIPEGRGATWPPATYAAHQTESAFLTESALEWLASPERGDDAWCAHLSYLRPHPPYIVPSPYNNMFDPADMPETLGHLTAQTEAEQHPFIAAALTIVPSPADELDQRQLQATYFGMIAEVDHQVGVLLDGLDQLGCSENTIVILTSDHGEQLGDHWFLEKLGFFDQSYRIPLIIRAPGRIDKPGRPVEAFTENVDIFPTLLELIGEPPMDFCDGASLVPFLEQASLPATGPANWRSAVHFEFDFREPNSTIIESIFGIRQDQCAISVIRDHQAKYVHFAGGLPPLFYDLKTDPEELYNKAADPALASQVLTYAQRLLTLKLEHSDPRLANTRATGFGTIHRADPARPGIQSPI